MIKGARARAEVIQIHERRERRGTRLPDDFVVPGEWLEDAGAARERARLGGANLAVEAVKFVNHYSGLAGIKGFKTNWPGAFVNWCLSPLVPKFDERAAYIAEMQASHGPGWRPL